MAVMSPSERPILSTAPTMDKKIRASKVRLNIDIDRTLHKKLKQLALDEDRRVSDIVREMIEHTVH